MTTREELTWDEKQRNDVGTRASENMLGPNPVVGLRGKDILDTTKMLIKQSLKQPHLVVRHDLKFARSAWHILRGESKIAPSRKDRRFNDPTWQENGLYRRALQLYLSADRELHNWAETVDLPDLDKERAHFVLSLVTDALAPSNTVLNPVALKRVFETGGKSAQDGLRHFLNDIRDNGGLPSQVDKKRFCCGRKLGKNVGYGHFS